MSRPRKPRTTKANKVFADEPDKALQFGILGEQEPDDDDEQDDDDPNEGDPAMVSSQANTTGDTAPKAEVRFSLGLAEVICERIAIGEPLQRICADDGMPTVTQIHRWIRKYAKFEELYEQARILQADYLADEMLVLADEMRQNPTRAPALRAAADLLTKQAEWRAPRKYGPKMELTLNERAKTPDEIKAEIARLRDELGVPKGRIARLK